VRTQIEHVPERLERARRAVILSGIRFGVDHFGRREEADRAIRIALEDEDHDFLLPVLDLGVVVALEGRAFRRKETQVLPAAIARHCAQTIGCRVRDDREARSGRFEMRRGGVELIE
jgi:hypothetical protein